VFYKSTPSVRQQRGREFRKQTFGVLVGQRGSVGLHDTEGGEVLFVEKGRRKRYQSDRLTEKWRIQGRKQKKKKKKKKKKKDCDFASQGHKIENEICGS